MTPSLEQLFMNDGARLLLALLLVGGTLLLLATDRAVPDVLYALDGSAITFFFSVSVAKRLC